MSAEDREHLRAVVAAGTSAHALALRSKIILSCADGADNVTVPAGLGVTSATVG